MRIRTVKPEFWTDPKVGALSPRARLAFIWTWSAADDHGRLRLSPALLRSGAFPYDEVTLRDAESIQTELINARMILPYDAHGERYGLVRTFFDHQKVDHPGKPRYPDPPEGIETVSRESRESLAPEQGTGNREMEQGTGKGIGNCPYEVLKALWNETVAGQGFPQKRTVNDTLKARIKTKWSSEPGVTDSEDYWRRVFEGIRDNPFYHDKGWCDFAWCFGNDRHGNPNHENILNGKHREFSDSGSSGNGNAFQQQAEDAWGQVVDFARKWDWDEQTAPTEADLDPSVLKALLNRGGVRQVKTAIEDGKGLNFLERDFKNSLVPMLKDDAERMAREAQEAINAE